MRKPAVAATLALLFAAESLQGPAPPAADIRFKSQIDSTYEALEHLQQQFRQCEPREGKEEMLRRSKAFLEAECKTTDYNWECKQSALGLETVRHRLLNTRCEDPSILLSWGFFAETLADELRARRPSLSPPAWATLRFGHMNPRAVRFDNGDEAVLFNYDMERFHGDVLRFLLNLYDIRVVSRGGQPTLEFIRDDAKVRRTLAEHDRADYFAELVTTATKGLPMPIPLAAPNVNHEGRLLRHTLEASGLHQRVLATLASSGVDFIVAHEFAHVLLGHRRGPWRVAPLVPGDSSTVLTPADANQRSELDADRLGFQLTMKLHVGVDRDLARMFVQGPEVVMVSLRLIELEQERLREPLADVDTHPPADVRRRALHDLSSPGGDASRSLAADLLHLATYSWATAHRLCDGTHADFADACKLEATQRLGR